MICNGDLDTHSLYISASSCDDLVKHDLIERMGEKNIDFSVVMPNVTFGKALELGVPMSEDVTARLNEIASNVLVESTEQSRSGAGE